MKVFLPFFPLASTIDGGTWVSHLNEFLSAPVACSSACQIHYILDAVDYGALRT